MRQFVSDAQLEQAIKRAGAFLNSREGVTPHAVIEGLVGIENYRRMMECPDTEHLAAYAEDALSFDAALEFAAHESRCPLCRSDVAELRTFVGQAVARLFTGVPAWVTPFVGRDNLRQAVESALESPTNPWVTVAAPAGMGKTRLLLEVAVDQAHQFPDGVWYVPLDESRDMTQLASDIARAVNVPPDGRTDALTLLRSFFTDRRSLLMFDNGPIHGPLADIVSDLSLASPGLKCLSASRGVMDRSAEGVVSLPPMVMSVRDDTRRAEVLPEAVRLFAAHVRTFDSDFDYDAGDNRAVVGEICLRAAGIPLAIELAAARAREMSTDEIADSLKERWQSSSDELSLNGLLQWSYEILPKRHQKFLNRLSVFSGSFYAEQAAEICEDDEALRLIEYLHHNALVQRCETSQTVRYQLLDPVKSFSRSMLGPELRTVLKRHASCFLRYAQDRACTLETRSQLRAMEDLEADLSNLRAGMDWAESEKEWLITGSYGIAMNRFFFFHGDWKEAERRLRSSVRALENAEDEPRRNRARFGLAYSLTTQGDFAEASELFTELAQRAEDLGDKQSRSEALHGLGSVAQRIRNYHDASKWFTQSLDGFIETGDDWRATDCRLNLGWVKSRLGDFAEAERLLKASLVLLRERGDRYRIGEALSNLGYIACARGNWDEARQRFEACLQARQEVGFVSGVANMINNLGDVWQSLGDTSRASYCYGEAARRFEKLGLKRDLGLALANQGTLFSNIGETALARDKFTEALRLWENAEDYHNVARVLGDLGKLEDKDGNRLAALRRYQESLARLHVLGIRSESLLALGLCAIWAAKSHELADEALALRLQDSALILLNFVVASVAQSGLAEQTDFESHLRMLEGDIEATVVAKRRMEAGDLTIDQAVGLALKL